MFSYSTVPVSIIFRSLCMKNYYFLTANPKYDLGKPLVLDKPMFCICGFSANSGNKLAKHLGELT